PEAALATLMGTGILFFIILYFIRKWHKSNVFETRTMVRIFGSSLLVFVASMLLIGFVIALVFGNVERNFNPHTLTLTVFYYFLNGIIYGSFFLAYYYYQINKKHQQKLASYHEALS